MASVQDAALPPPNSKIAKAYFANVSSIVSRTITIQVPASDCQVYVPRPSSLTSFTDSTLDALLDSVKFNDDDMEGYEHRIGSGHCLRPSHLIHYEMLHSRRGKPTNKGLLIFKICPFTLLVSKTMNLRGYDIQFSFLSRDTHCHECGCAGHCSDYCYHLYEAGLPTIFFDGDGFASYSPPAEKKEKEKVKDSNSKKGSNDDVTAVEAKKAPNRGRGRHR